MEPEKPFACNLPDCGMTFTNEDHLHVHTKKHDMVLQLGMEQRAAFVADQTPTPTRFIRNCEEVGLFQDLQNVAVNPFDEGFKRAMETKHGLLSLDGSCNEDVLHTPHLVFPLEGGDCTLYAANNQRNITISRSSSDESGAVKEYETTKISKLTNEVTRISRLVGKDILDRVTTTDDVSIITHGATKTNGDRLNETSVSYTNNVIKIHSNVEIRKDNVNVDTKKTTGLTNADSLAKDTINIDVLLTDAKKDSAPPIMSQRSLDFVVDSLTSDTVIRDDTIAKPVKRKYETRNKADEKSCKVKKVPKVDEDYEVIIKLPNGKQVRMKAVEETEKAPSVNAKEKLNKTIRNKIEKPAQRIQSIPNAIIQNVVPIAAGTLIPVTIMNSTVPILQSTVPKIPIVPLTSTVKRNFKTVRRKTPNRDRVAATESNGPPQCGSARGIAAGSNDGQDWSDREHDETRKRSKYHLVSRSAASKRYRERLKQTMQMQNDENKHLREANRRLTEEKAALQLIITQHLQECPAGEALSRNLQEQLRTVT